MVKVAHKFEVRYFRGGKLVATESRNGTLEDVKHIANNHGSATHKADRFELELVRRVRTIVEYDRDAGIGQAEPAAPGSRTVSTFAPPQDYGTA